MSASRLSGLTVLIVEDEPLIALSLEDLLTDYGALCLGPVGSVRGALRMISVSRFDMALLDFNLRGERIDPVADHLAAAGIPFIFTTGYGEDARPSKHRDRPVLAKPYTDGAVIDAVLRHRSQSDGSSG